MKKRINSYDFFKSPLLMRKYKRDAKKALEHIYDIEDIVNEYRNNGANPEKVFTSEAKMGVIVDGNDICFTEEKRVWGAILLYTYIKEIGSDSLDSKITIINPDKQVMSSINFTYTPKKKPSNQIAGIESADYTGCIAARQFLKRLTRRNRGAVVRGSIVKDNN